MASRSSNYTAATYIHILSVVGCLVLSEMEQEVAAEHFPTFFRHSKKTKDKELEAMR